MRVRELAVPRALPPLPLRSPRRRRASPRARPARVRVERYTMPDGSRQFAVYIAGTPSGAFGGATRGTAGPTPSCTAGSASASYEATVAALRRPAREPGDVVHAFGHSQGAMITAHLALEGGYDMRTLVSFGRRSRPMSATGR